MRAVVHDSYGSPDVLRLAEVETPSPGDDELLVRVDASTVNRSDCGFRAAKPFITRWFTGLARPKRKILGSEFAGEVVETGSAVATFAVGDRVFAIKGATFGGHAEYVCVPEAAPVALQPSNVTSAEAAAICDGAMIALTCLRRADLRAGQRVLIYGASGAIGTAAVQLAKVLGAHVTAVCNTKNLDVVKSLGPDEVIDYEQTDLTTIGQTYDVVFDAVGKRSYRTCRHLVTKGGWYLTTDLGFMWHVPLLAVATRWVGDHRVSLPVPKQTKADAEYLRGLVESGRYRPVIDRAYPLDQIVEATEYVETGQKVGNVVITVSADANDGPGAR